MSTLHHITKGPYVNAHDKACCCLQDRAPNGQGTCCPSRQSIHTSIAHHEMHEAVPSNKICTPDVQNDAR